MEPIYYQIGEHEFYQDVSSAWQKAKIVQLLGDRDVPSLDAFGLMQAIGPEDILAFYALLLVPKGMSKEDFIKHSLTPGSLDHTVLFATHIGESQTLEILADFLAFTLEPSNIERMTKALGRINQMFPSLGQVDSSDSSDSLPLLPEATPLTESPSSR